MTTPKPPASAGSKNPATSTGRGRARPLRVSDVDDLELDFPDDDHKDEGTHSADHARDDESFLPEDDSDFELDTGLDGESIGLDTTTGFEEDGELTLDDTGEDDVSWTHDSEDSSDLPGAEADLLGGEEYGWLGDDEAPDDEDDAFDADIDGELTVTQDDGGAEGLDDDTDLDSVDLAKLPALNTDAEGDDAEGLGAEALEDLAGVLLPDEPVLEIAGASWPTLPSHAMRSVRVTEQPTQALAGHGGSRIVCTDVVSLLTGDALRATRLSLEGQRALALAVSEHEGRTTIAVATDSSVFVSLDGGRRFAERPASAPGVRALGFTVGARGPRLWSLRGDGMLTFVDKLADDETEVGLDGRVLAFDTDGGKRVSALVLARDGRLRMASSRDSGRRFSWSDVPETVASDLGLPGAPPQSLRTCRDAILLSGGASVQCGERLTALEPMPATLGTPTTLLDEDDTVFAYACMIAEGKVHVLRRQARAQAATTIIGALDAGAVGEVHALLATQRESLLSVYVATSRGLFRLDASLDGEALAWAPRMPHSRPSRLRRYWNAAWAAPVLKRSRGRSRSTCTPRIACFARDSCAPWPNAQPRLWTRARNR